MFDMKKDLNNLLIHVGYHKTGTSWLQQKLFSSKSEYFKPVSSGVSGQSSLIKSFVYDEEGYLLSPFENNYERIYRDVESIIKNIDFGSKIPIISHERFSGNPHSGGFDAKKIAKMLNVCFPNAKILIVIREQKSFIMSNYFQYLSIGGTYGLGRYLNTKYDGKRPFFMPNHINYTFLVKEYQELYGKKNVLILPYEMFKGEPELFFYKLGDFLNLEIKVNEKCLRSTVNKKKYKFSMYYLRFMNLFKSSASVNNYSFFCGRYSRFVVSGIFMVVDKVLPQKKEDFMSNRLKKKIRLWVGDRYVDSNRLLSQMIDIDLSKYGYY